jgi:GNAT superfamily N-acetyltransferase
MDTVARLTVTSPDLSDADMVAQMWQVRERDEQAARVEPYHETLEQYAEEARYAFPGERNETGVVLLDGRVAGTARIWFPDRDNLTLCWSEVRVDPDHRGKGVGSALAEWLEDRARANERSVHAIEVAVPVGARDDHPARLFAERRGYSVASTEIVRSLPLPIAPALLDRLEASARPAWAGEYDLSVHHDGVPPELRPSLCEAMNRLGLDAPTGELELEEESLDPEGYQHFLDHEARLGRHRITTVALHRGTGVVAAYTDLVLTTGSPDLVFQWGTLVLPEHRGRRLGLAVKVANLRALAAHHPGRRAVITQNAEANPWMVSINEALGFEIIEESLDLKKDL